MDIGSAEIWESGRAEREEAGRVGRLGWASVVVRVAGTGRG